MTVLVQMDFPYQGPFGKEMTESLSDMARSIAEEPGFLWKIWTENPASGEAGGVYLFEDRKAAEAYRQKHTARLEEQGISGIRTRLFDVNEGLSAITRGPGG